MLKKILSSVLLLSSLVCFGAPQSPPNGGTGINNDIDSTIKINGAYPVQFNLVAATQANLMPGHTVYVDCLSGSDVTGNGSTLSKFATVSHAEAVITTASPTNPYGIDIAPGVCTETDLTLKPNVWINGNNATLNVTASIFLDSGFGSGNNSLFVSDLQLNPSNETIWDFTSFGAHNAFISLKNVRVLQNWDFSILGTSQEIVAIDSLYATSPQVNVTLQDVYGGFANGSPYNISIINTGNYSGSVMTLTSNEVLGNVLIQTQGAQNQIVNLTGNSIGIFGGTLTLDGANVVALFDTPSFVTPTLLNGAGYDLKSIADGLNSNYSAVNYTNTDTSNNSVQGALHGIDNALGALANYSIAHQFWVDAINGSDSGSRNGSITQPFASYGYALSQAQGSSSPTNVYGINIVGNQTISGNMDLNPYVVVNCTDSGAINVSGYVDLDGYWGSANNVNTALVENCLINSGNGFEFIFSGDENLLAFRNVDPGTTSTMVATSPGSPANGNGLLVQGMVSREGQPIFPGQVDINNGFLYAENMTVNGTLYVNALGTTNTFANLVSSQVSHLYINSDESTGGTASANLQSTQLNALTVAAALSSVTSDVGSYVTPSFAAGATISQVSVINNIDGLAFSPNFTPTNFTLVGSSSYGANTTTAAFAGLDAALGALVPGTPIAQQLFVNATNGNDSNTGTASNHALATYDGGAYPICLANASSSNPYNVYVIGNASVSSNFNIVPYCNVFEVGGVMTVPGEVLLDSSFGSVSSSKTTIDGTFSVGTDINLQFGAGDQNLVVLEIDPTTTPGLIVESPNTNPNGNAAWVNIKPSANMGIFPSVGVNATDVTLILDNAPVAGSINIIGTGAPNAAFFFQNSFFNSTLSLVGVGSPMYAQGMNSLVSSLSIQGTDPVYDTDVASYPLGLSYASGATNAQIGLFSEASDGGAFSSQFTPVNFSLTTTGNWPADSITSAFAGIDAKLGTLTPNAGAFPWTFDGTNSSNLTTVNFLFGTYQIVGNYVFCNVTVQVYPNNTTSALAFTAPFLSGNFPAGNYASITAQGSIQPAPGPAPTFGVGTNQPRSLAGTNSLIVPMTTGSIGLYYQVNLSFSYQYQNF